jgi:vancomycin resistance protein VanW
MNESIKQPIKRSKLRQIIGIQYFTIRRYLHWYFGKHKFANTILKPNLPYIVFRHKTPLIRRLKDVDMYLQQNKVINLKLAIQKLKNIIIKPGETFSYWRLIGKPTYRKGYKDGLVLNPDGTFRAGVGGGLCQLSNLIYWMTLHTPLEVTQRYRHSHDIFPDSDRTQPFGSGATCVYNYLDLQLYNCTDINYQLNVYLDDEFLIGEWRAEKAIDYKYEVYEKKHKITSTFWGAYIRQNEIYRRNLI